MANSELRMDNVVMTRLLAGLLIVLAVPQPLRGQTEADARKKVDASLAALKAGEYETALEGFRDAEVSFPESCELAYNRGVALYRLGAFDEAKAAFAEALSTRDLSLEQRTKFNLGNCAYSQALQKLTDYAGAIEELRRAIDYYRDALELDPKDQDARANIETAYLLIKDLLDKKKKEEEEKEKQEPPTSQPSQDPQCSQPSEGQEEQQKESQSRESQDPQQQQQGGEQQPSKQEQPSQPQEGELESADPQRKQEQQQAGKPDEKQTRKMTKEEAARLLQAVRDRERERREELRRRQMIGRLPVDRDW